jgi:1A family penicillin-binding protein
MPIPQLSKKNKIPQSWRDDKITDSVRQRIQQSRQLRTGGGRAGQFSSWRAQTPSHKKKSYRPSPLMLYRLLKLALILVIFGVIYFLWISRDLPNPNKLIDRDIAESTKIYDRTGETILYEISGDQKRTIVKLEEIPEYVKWATITAEDRSFYEHHGFNFLAIIRSVILNPLMGKRIAGGSTLTQQLVKNAILTDERKISRKIRELVLSYRIEQKFSKDEILQMYLNEIPYGSTAYGIEAAARRYFGISAKELNIAQAATLAAIPQAPTYYYNNFDVLIARQEYILKEMQKLGYIKKNQLDEALAFDIKFKDPDNNILAPHFVMYIKELLGQKYGEQVIEREGLKIYTTLDLDKQKIAEEVLQKQAETNEKSYNASNAALVSIDTKTGQILAMVGSRDYFNDDIDGQVNVATRPRQPGSSLKPLVYAMAFAKGYTPDTVLYDVVTNFAAAGKAYEPHNYDNQEHGPITMRQALAGSLNIPAVKALYLAGVENVVAQAQKMGYTTLTDPERYGLSLVLGGGEVKLLEHTAAYGVFAREGEYRPPVAILKVEDRNGKVLEEYKEEKAAVLSAKLARLVNSILSDNGARAYVFGAQNWLTLKDRPVAAKTGTTNDYKDAWTIGYTPSLVTGVWVGNNDSTEMKRGADGSKIAAPIWNGYMQRVLSGTPVEGFNAAEKEITGKAVLDGASGGKITVKIDKASGLLATDQTPAEMIEERQYQLPHDILYYCKKDDPRGAEPKPEERDVQYQIWEDAVKKWAEREKITLDEVPTEYDNIHKPENLPQININLPKDNANVAGKILTSEVTVNAPLGLGRVEYYIDDHLIGVSSAAPYNMAAEINFLNNGAHKLTAKACDIKENCFRAVLQFNYSLPDNERDTILNLKWLSPIANAKLTAANFPLPVKINSINPRTIKEINFYFQAENENDSHLFSSLQNFAGNDAVGVWSGAPATGKYYLYAEASGWVGNSKKTEKVKVIIEK